MSAAEPTGFGLMPAEKSESPAVADTPRAVQFLDLPSEHSFGRIRAEAFAFGLLTGLVCVAATFGVAALRLPAIWSAVPILAFAGYGVASVVASRRRGRRWALEKSAQYPQAAALLEAGVPLLTGEQVYRVWPPLLREMNKRGDRGVAVRVRFENTSVSEIEPLTIEFEPLPLDGGDERFRQLAGGEPFPSNEEESSQCSANTTRRLRREAWRNRYLLASFAFALLTGAIGAIFSRQFSWMTLYWLATILIVLFGPLRAAAVRGDSFLLVPGGLIWRRGRLFDARYRLHLFRAADSLLAVIPLAGRWSFYLRDAEHETGTQIDDSEAEMLLRAWLSPLPPPDDRLLNELGSNADA